MIGYSSLQMDVPTEKTAKEKAMREFKDDASSANWVFGRHRAQPPATGNICALRVLEELQGKSLSMSKPQVRSYTEAVATPVGLLFVYSNLFLAGLLASF
ncbi:uncharacterized protein RSE6_08883 [Rhynchosporium secalis]|uniref:Uncharacterized protein n=1 Tax=Rhynchosporium secalis TaxID=38038 RepID=A0A1E1MGK2_RHYSE|nr:uncharacterized protein RSE6_08883 [Rhynchosporium secalis]